jgi:Rrf2 family protein
LSKANLVSSIRGTKGGYRLARPSAEIHLNEIIKVLDDEDVLAGHCKSYAGVLDNCIHTGDCGIRPVIVGLHEIVSKALSGITLAQLIGTEATVDQTIHQIQGLRTRVESVGERVQ